MVKYIVFMIITIGGNLGAGKTTLAKKLAEALRYEELYVGGIFREMATEKGMSIEQFYEALKNDPSLEHSVDERQATLMRTKDNLVVQGRIAWYFAQSSPFQVFNIFLKVDSLIGAARTGERKENTGRSAEEMKTATAEREKMERERYLMLYGITDHLDPAHYDFMLDTTSLSEQEVFDRVMTEVRTRLQS